MSDGTGIPVLILAGLAGLLIVSVAVDLFHERMTVERRRREQRDRVRMRSAVDRWLDQRIGEEP